MTLSENIVTKGTFLIFYICHNVFKDRLYVGQSNVVKGNNNTLVHEPIREKTNIVDSA